MGNSLHQPITEMATCTGKINDMNDSKDDDKCCSWGVSSMQGWRPTMEDAHICQQVLDTVHLFCVLDGHGGTTAADYASQHLCSILLQQQAFREYMTLTKSTTPPAILPSSATTTSDQPKGGGNKKHNKKSKKNAAKQGPAKRRQHYDKERAKNLLQRALEDAFVELDLLLLHHMVTTGEFSFSSQAETNGLTSENNNTKEQQQDEWDSAMTDLEDDYSPPQAQNNNNMSVSGTTATAVLLTPDFFVCANVGDSRAILVQNRNNIVELSRDHKPTCQEERQRIEQAGGSVNMGRVDGELAVSRAIGDYEFKPSYEKEMITSYCRNDDSLSSSSGTTRKSITEEQRTVAKQSKVTPFPEIIMAPRDDDRLLILACDGIWDVVSNSECVQLVQTLFQEGETDMGLVCEEMTYMCLNKGSRDNMTIIVAKMDGQEQSIGLGGGVRKRRRQRQNKVMK